MLSLFTKFESLWSHSISQKALKGIPDQILVFVLHDVTHKRIHLKNINIYFIGIDREKLLVPIFWENFSW